MALFQRLNSCSEVNHEALYNRGGRKMKNTISGLSVTAGRGRKPIANPATTRTIGIEILIFSAKTERTATIPKSKMNTLTSAANPCIVFEVTDSQI